MLTLPPRRVTLDNGLKLVIAADRSFPVVSVSVHYGVGYRSEPEGLSGFSHLFEHLMFRGSAHVPAGQHMARVHEAGGTANATTHQDYTAYVQTVPSEALEQVLWLESDRMAGPSLTEDGLRAEVAVVKEEITQQIEGRPFGGFPWMWLPPVLYDSYANSHNGYGDYPSLERVRLADCEKFAATWYSPANAVLTIAGDTDPDAAEDLVRGSFGLIAAGPPVVSEPLREASPRSRRWATREDSRAPYPVVAVGRRLPDPAEELDEYVAHMALASLLTDGRGARLTRRLAAAGASAPDARARCGFFRYLDARDPDTFTVRASCADLPPETVVDCLDAELNRLAEAEPDPSELSPLRARMSTSLYRRCGAVSDRATFMGATELLFDRGDLLSHLQDHIDQVSGAAISRAAARLGSDPGAVLTVTPTADAPADRVPTGSRTVRRPGPHAEHISTVGTAYGRGSR